MKKINLKWPFLNMFQCQTVESKDESKVDTRNIVTVLSDEPLIHRYLVTVDSNGKTLETISIEGKSLIDSETARDLMRDMNQMTQRMREMGKRMGVLNGSCDIRRLDDPID